MWRLGSVVLDSCCAGFCCSWFPMRFQGGCRCVGERAWPWYPPIPLVPEDAGPRPPPGGLWTETGHIRVQHPGHRPSAVHQSGRVFVPAARGDEHAGPRWRGCRPGVPGPWPVSSHGTPGQTRVWWCGGTPAGIPPTRPDRGPGGAFVLESSGGPVLRRDTWSTRWVLPPRSTKDAPRVPAVKRRSPPKRIPHMPGPPRRGSTKRHAHSMTAAAGFPHPLRVVAPVTPP